MPAKSAKQFKMMAAIANHKGSKFDGGPSEKVAKEFVSKTPKSKRSMFMKQGAK